MSKNTRFSNNLFSFDVGTNSIGFCVLGLDHSQQPSRIIDIGSRVFSDGRDPKSKTSLAVARREARAMSRRRDRYLRRRKALLRTLTEYGLMPADQAARQALVSETGDRSRSSGAPSQNPYVLRARALDERLPLFYIGRVLFHLNQRRGFKSNRTTDRKDNEKGKIALGIDELKAQMHLAEARTYGEWLAARLESGAGTRLRADSDIFSAEGYAFYPERSLLEEEFREIWQAQSKFYPEYLTSSRCEHLFKVIFYQRPLKKPLVGKCAFNPLETRLAKAHPLFQEFRLYKEINELELVLPDLSHRKLDLDQRDVLVTLMRGARDVTFKKIRQTLKLAPDITFNKQNISREKIRGDEVYSSMAEKKVFGAQWSRLSSERQWQIIKRLKDEESPEVLTNWLKDELDLDETQIAEVVNVSLPEGYGRLGLTAISSMLEEMKREVIPESDAAKRCGYDHSRLAYECDEGEAVLPPYQEVLSRHIPPGTFDLQDDYDVRMGRFTNPTVHIGLNQLRRLVNKLISRYGKPSYISLELSRDLQLNERQKAEVNRTIAKNTREVSARSAKLLELGQRDTGLNRLLLKLWEELNPNRPEDRVCIYSGKPIGIEMLFSAEVDIDHILPWSKTLDDSQSNKILCLKAANREKRNRAPADVPEWRDRYDEILSRAGRLSPNKRRRFAPDAMVEFEKERDFLARQLTDTQYLSRMAREYLSCLFPSEEPHSDGELRKRARVIVSPGRLTEMLRRNWGLNNLLSDDDLNQMARPKNRQDHRHHAIDAAVIGVTTRSLLQRISSAAARFDHVDFEAVVKKMVAENPPWQGFRDDLKIALSSVVVSHKADHGTIYRRENAGGRGQTAGQLHNDTAYGLGVDENGNAVAVRRKPLMSLELKDLPAVRDKDLQAELFEAIGGLSDKKLVEAALLNFRRSNPKFKGIRRVRVSEKLSLIPITDQNGRAYKGYKGDANYRYDVWETLSGKWQAEVVSMFDAHQKKLGSAFHAANPTARRVLRLQQNDMVAYEHPVEGYTIGRVVKFVGDGRMYLAGNREGGSLKSRDEDKHDPFKYLVRSAAGLKEIKCRQVRVDETGRVFDPGPQDRASKVVR